jgi:hypothetical protein
MELTFPLGALDPQTRSDIKVFYGDIFGFDSLDVPILGQTGLLLRTDPETSQFLLLMEQEVHIASPGYDHLGFLLEDRAAVDAKLEQVKKWQERDTRLKIKEYDDLVVGDVTTHAFYFRYLLPIWFDVQVIETPASGGPRWSFG